MFDQDTRFLGILSTGTITEIKTEISQHVFSDDEKDPILANIAIDKKIVSFDLYMDNQETHRVFATFENQEEARNLFISLHLLVKFWDRQYKYPYDQIDAMADRISFAQALYNKFGNSEILFNSIQEFVAIMRPHWKRQTSGLRAKLKISICSPNNPYRNFFDYVTPSDPEIETYHQVKESFVTAIEEIQTKLPPLEEDTLSPAENQQVEDALAALDFLENESEKNADATIQKGSGSPVQRPDDLAEDPKDPKPAEETQKEDSSLEDQPEEKTEQDESSEDPNTGDDDSDNIPEETAVEDTQQTEDIGNEYGSSDIEMTITVPKAILDELKDEFEAEKLRVQELQKTIVTLKAEKAKIEADLKKCEANLQTAHEEKKRQEAEEAARIERERKAAERKAREEQERKAREEKKRQEAKRLEAERAAEEAFNKHVDKIWKQMKEYNDELTREEVIALLKPKA